MKSSIETIFEEHSNLIDYTIWKNLTLLKALRLENEDVAQDLSIAMLSAIKRFNPGCVGEQRSDVCSATSPERSDSLATYISCSLQYEILNMTKRYKPNGITGIPKSARVSIIYTDSVRDDGEVCEFPIFDNINEVLYSELSDSLSNTEEEAQELKIKGFKPRRKAQIAALLAVSGKDKALYYEDEGRIAA